MSDADEPVWDGLLLSFAVVVKNAAILADQYGADKEIVMIAAWLQDIASITDYSLYEQHHIHGAEMVQECIKSHRGSVVLEKRSMEVLGE